MQARGGNRNAALLGALVIAAAAVAALVLLFGGAPRPAEPPKPPTLVANPQSASPDASESPQEAKVGRTADEATTPSGSAPISTGVLHLEFVSTLDGSPVADLPFLVYRERGGNKVFARGLSDARGRAEVRDLEENVILVSTSRRPPFASKVEACWLGHGEEAELVVGLDGGAQVVGRVLDLARKPVEGVEVLVAADHATESTSNPLDLEGAAAMTGPDGKFTVDHMANRPRGVWIVDGRARPERWDPAELLVRRDCEVLRKVPFVKPGTTFDLGDLILEGCATLAGSVLDSESRPVAGALVSWRAERHQARQRGWWRTEGDPRGFHVAPGEEGFRLLPGETLTDTGGGFELRAGIRIDRLAVWAPSGQRQLFTVPKAPPSGRTDDLVLRLDAITILEVELLDRNGARVTGPGASAREKGLVVPAWRTWNMPAAAFAVIRLEDGSREELTASADADGLFRFELKAAPSRLRSLALDLAGYQTVEDELEGRAQPTTRLSYTLRETPAIRLLLKNNSAVPPPAGSLKLELAICLASPEQRRNATEENCCGLGAYLWFDPPTEPREFVFPAIAPRPYWVYLGARPGARGLFQPGNQVPDQVAFGPFEAGDSVREIEADLAAIAVAPQRKETPPEPIEAGRKVPSAYVTARAVDARTDTAIPKFTILGRRVLDGKDIDSFAFFPVEEKGSTGSKRINPGSWDFTVRAEGYRKFAIPGVLLVEDQMKDLGTIALEPAPAFRARLIEHDGRPVPDRTWVQVLDAEHPLVAPADSADAEGRIVFYGEIPDRVLLEASEPSDLEPGEGSGSQRILVGDWREGEEKEIMLAAWQRVEVRIGGAAIDPPGTALRLRARVTPGEHEPLLEGREIDATPSRRVFRFRMVSGRYQVSGGDLLHEVPAQEIDVRESSEIQVFELSSR